MTTLVTLKNVSKSFSGKKLLDKVSLQLKAGEISVLVGQNGAGKTTLARIILGLDECESGEVIVKPNAKLGYVPQKLNFSSQLPMRAKELLGFIAPGADILQHEELVKFTNFIDIKNQDISELSGGGAQRLILAASFLNKPNLLILDEPTQFLDVEGQKHFYRLIKDLCTKWQISCLLISHDLFTVMRNADQVICLNGHICCSGTPEDITKNSEMQAMLATIGGQNNEIGLYFHHHDHKH